MLFNNQVWHHGDAHGARTSCYHGSKVDGSIYAQGAPLFSDLPKVPQYYKDALLNDLRDADGFPIAHSYPYPFFGDGLVIPVRKSYKSEEEHVMDLLSRPTPMPSYEATMSYRAPWKKQYKARHGVSQPKRRNRRYTPKISPKFVQTKFNKIPIRNLTLETFEELILKEIDAEVFPTLRLEPSGKRMKLNREIKRIFDQRNSVRKAIRKAVHAIFANTLSSAYFRFGTERLAKAFQHGIAPHKKQKAVNDLNRIRQLDRKIQAQAELLEQQARMDIKSIIADHYDTICRVQDGNRNHVMPPCEHQSRHVL